MDNKGVLVIDLDEPQYDLENFVTKSDNVTQFTKAAQNQNENQRKVTIDKIKGNLVVTQTLDIRPPPMECIINIDLTKLKKKCKRKHGEETGNKKYGTKNEKVMKKHKSAHKELKIKDKNKESKKGMVLVEDERISDRTVPKCCRKECQHIILRHIQRRGKYTGSNPSQKEWDHPKSSLCRTQKHKEVKQTTLHSRHKNYCSKQTFQEKKSHCLSSPSLCPISLSPSSLSPISLSPISLSPISLSPISLTPLSQREINLSYENISEDEFSSENDMDTLIQRTRKRVKKPVPTLLHPIIFKSKTISKGRDMDCKSTSIPTDVEQINDDSATVFSSDMDVSIHSLSTVILEPDKADSHVYSPITVNDLTSPRSTYFNASTLNFDNETERKQNYLRLVDTSQLMYPKNKKCNGNDEHNKRKPYNNKNFTKFDNSFNDGLTFTYSPSLSPDQMLFQSFDSGYYSEKQSYYFHENTCLEHCPLVAKYKATSVERDSEYANIKRRILNNEAYSPTTSPTELNPLYQAQKFELSAKSVEMDTAYAKINRESLNNEAYSPTTSPNELNLLYKAQKFELSAKSAEMDIEYANINRESLNNEAYSPTTSPTELNLLYQAEKFKISANKVKDVKLCVTIEDDQSDVINTQNYSCVGLYGRNAINADVKTYDQINKEKCLLNVDNRDNLLKDTTMPIKLEISESMVKKEEDFISNNTIITAFESNVKKEDDGSLQKELTEIL